MRHEIREWKEGFSSLCEGRRFEVRKDDRKYALGDELVIREWDHRAGELTGRVGFFRVTSVLRRTDAGGALEGLLAEGACVLGLQAIGPVPIFGELTPDMNVLVDWEMSLLAAHGRIDRVRHVADAWLPDGNRGPGDAIATLVQLERQLVAAIDDCQRLAIRVSTASSQEIV